MKFVNPLQFGKIFGVGSTFNMLKYMYLTYLLNKGTVMMVLKT